MLQAARTPGINIHTYSELEEVSGFVGMLQMIAMDVEPVLKSVLLMGTTNLMKG